MNCRCNESAASFYGTADVAALTGISAFTIRYYDKCGFFPTLERNKSGVRVFSASDIQQLHLIEALRRSGLSIEGIQYYVRLFKQGSATKEERIKILATQEHALESQQEVLNESLQLLYAERTKLLE